MGSMASNYDMNRLVLGLVLAVAAVVCAVTGTYLSSPDGISSFLPFSFITVAYGIMMFASSYVEEEHHFWYWATSAWLGLMTLKGFKRYLSSFHAPS